MKLNLFIVLAILPLSSIAQEAPAAFTGIWSGSMTTPEHDYWRVEDFISCWAGCPAESFEFLSSLLDDPANDDKTMDELNGQFFVHMRESLAGISTPQGLELQQGSTNENNPSINCHDYGYLRQSINPLPLQMVMEGDVLHINYEEWNLSRMVYLDGREFPENIEHTRLGYSIGHYADNGDLVIETRAISEEIYNPFHGGGGHSDQLTGVERYSLKDDGKVLSVVMTLTDPVTLKEPYEFYKQWVTTPELELLEDFCTDIPGEF
jgi:hypothetical protein